jgi:mono/diheme cytochrome c family protein
VRPVLSRASIFGSWMLLGCGSVSTTLPGEASGGSAGVTTNTGPAIGAAGGLPCDVHDLLQTHCVGCHSSPPVGGAPMPLETFADLSAPARSDPTRSVAQMSLSRILNKTLPMPPASQPALASQEIASFQAWVNSGASAGTCITASAEGGTPMPDPYATPVQCSSGVTTMLREGSRMRPGDTCVSCHAQSGGEAPMFSIGGTVYNTAHEPTNCNGVNVAGASVVITDANNKTFTISVNSAGNFYTSAPVATPFHAKVLYGGAERAMSAAQTSGDCDSCHTESGANGAPGRIMLP